jgi:NAD(P)-dependent dehydrogenase (short-subunit alcohol dehydrogenase family)
VTAPELFDISGKVALVSGASGALGAAVAKGLAGAGAKVMLTGRDTGRLTPIADEIAGAGGATDTEAGAPDDPSAVATVVGATVDRLGGLDILVTAAGMNQPAPIVDQSLEDWRAIVDSQLTTTWLLCKETGRVMIDRGRGGKVILVGSQRGKLGMANYGAYSPAKAAVHLLAQTLAWEWGPHGIQVNCLAPGLFRSSLTEWMWDDQATYQRLLGRIPHGRLGEPEDFVGPVLFLASRASDWMTGGILSVDGGYTAG